MQKQVSVTDLSTYIYCPRSLFMQKVMKASEPLNGAMIMGSVKHSVFESSAEAQEKATLTVTEGTTLSEAMSIFRQLYLDSLKLELQRKAGIIEQFGISKEKVLSELSPLLEKEALNRAEYVHNFAMQNKVYGYSLWETIFPKIFPEFKVASRELRLRGVIDKVELYKDKCVTYEMKTGKPPQYGVWPSHRVQITAYSMLSSRRFNVPSTESYVFYTNSGEARRVMINPFMEQEVIDTTDRVIQLFEAERPPEQCKREMCSCKQT